MAKHPDVKDLGFVAGINGCKSPSEVISEQEASWLRVAEIVSQNRRLIAENERLRAELRKRGL